jgi:hypothetical protein
MTSFTVSGPRTTILLPGVMTIARRRGNGPSRLKTGPGGTSKSGAAVGGLVLSGGAGLPLSVPEVGPVVGPGGRPVVVTDVADWMMTVLSGSAGPLLVGLVIAPPKVVVLAPGDVELDVVDDAGVVVGVGTMVDAVVDGSGGSPRVVVVVDSSSGGASIS